MAVSRAYQIKILGIKYSGGNSKYIHFSGNDFQWHLIKILSKIPLGKSKKNQQMTLLDQIIRFRTALLKS
jgi:hypothetical protein